MKLIKSCHGWQEHYSIYIMTLLLWRYNYTKIFTGFYSVYWIINKYCIGKTALDSALHQGLFKINEDLIKEKRKIAEILEEHGKLI